MDVSDRVSGVSGSVECGGNKNEYKSSLPVIRRQYQVWLYPTGVEVVLSVLQVQVYDPVHLHRRKEIGRRSESAVDDSVKAQVGASRSDPTGQQLMKQSTLSFGHNLHLNATGFLWVSP